MDRLGEEIHKRKDNDSVGSDLTGQVGCKSNKGMNEGMTDSLFKREMH